MVTKIFWLDMVKFLIIYDEEVAAYLGFVHDLLLFFDPSKSWQMAIKMNGRCHVLDECLT